MFRLSDKKTNTATAPQGWVRLSLLLTIFAACVLPQAVLAQDRSGEPSVKPLSSGPQEKVPATCTNPRNQPIRFFMEYTNGQIDFGTWYGQGNEIYDTDSNDPCLEYHDGDTDIDAAQIHLSCSVDYDAEPTAVGNGLTVVHWSFDRPGFNGGVCGDPFPGTLIIEKVTDPTGAGQSFGFSSPQSAIGSFSLSDGQSESFLLAPATYSVSEDAESGWNLTGLVCDPAAGTTTDLPSRTASVTVVQDVTVTCTFTNEQVILTPGIEITKDDGQTAVDEGSSYAYTLSYENTGELELTNVTISDTVPANTTFDAAGSTAGWSCADNSGPGTVCNINIGTLAVGATGSVSFGLTVDDNLQVPDPTTGLCPGDPGLQVDNTGAISGDSSNGSVNDNDGDVNDINTFCTPLQPGITIDKNDGNASVDEGSSYAYTLSYENTGAIPLTGVTITDTVPPLTTFNAGLSDGGWSCVPDGSAGSVCTINIGNLAVGATGSVQFGLTVDDDLQVPDPQTGECPGDPGHQINNTGFITGTSGNGNVDDSENDVNSVNTSCTPLEPGVQIIKDDGQTSVDEGTSFAYTLSYSNTGDLDLTGVTISDTVPANTTFNAAGSTGTWSCADDSGPGTVCTTTIGSLLADGSEDGSVQFGLTVDDDLQVPDEETGLCPGDPGLQVDNTGTISDDSDPAVTDSDSDVNDINTSCTPLEPGIQITKDDGQTAVDEGSSFAYTLSYENTGEIPLTGVTITDTVPANTTFNAGLSDAGWSCTGDGSAGSVCTINIGSLAVDATGSVAFGLTVDDDLQVPDPQTGECPGDPGLQVDNTGQISATSGNGDVNDSDNDVDDINTSCTPLDPGLSVVKKTNGTEIRTGFCDNGITVGESVEWTYAVTNTGDIPLGISSIVDDAGTPGSTGDDFNPAFVDGDAGTANVLDPGETWNYSAGGSAQAGEYSNTVTVQAEVLGEAQAKATPGTIIESSDVSGYCGTSVDLAIEKTDGGLILVPEGGTFSYQLTYTNLGTEDLTGVVITETVPENTVFDTDGSTAGWSCADGAAAGTSCTFNVGAVAAGASGSVDFGLEVLELVEPDPETGECPTETPDFKVDNTASIVDDGSNGADSNTNNNQDSDDTPIATDCIPQARTPSITIEKSPEGQIVEAGDVANFTIKVTNNGELDLINVVVTDPKSPNCDKNIGDLPVGGTSVYNCEMKPVINSFTNVAKVTGETDQGGDVSDEDDADVTVLNLDEPEQQHHPIPTMSQWGLILMAGLMLMLGVARAREWTRR